jgi:hypothetical protein
MTLNGSNECDECVSKLKSYMALTLLFFFFFLIVSYLKSWLLMNIDYKFSHYIIFI